MSTDLLLIADSETGKWVDDGFPAQALHSYDEIREAFEDSRKDRRTTVWIADRASQLSALAEEHDMLLRPNHRLLLLEETKDAQRDVLHVVFRIVVAPGNGMHILPVHERKEALDAPHRADLFVGGV